MHGFGYDLVALECPMLVMGEVDPRAGWRGTTEGLGRAHKSDRLAPAPVPDDRLFGCDPMQQVREEFGACRKLALVPPCRTR